MEPQEILRIGFNSVIPKEGAIEIVGYGATSSEVLVELHRLKPDVLLLDECCDANLVAAANEIGIPSIVFSSKSDAEAVFEALSTGAKAYILKGTSIALLARAIEAVGSGACWLDPGIAKKAIEAITAVHRAAATESPIYGVHDTLSLREIEVLSLLCDGLNNNGIARSLSVSRETAKTHIRHIMEKLQVNTRTEAAVLGIKLGISINGHRTTKELASSC